MRHALHANIHIVLVVHAVLKHVELQHAHHTDYHFFHAAVRVLENLDRALVGDLGGALDELLALHRVHLTHERKMFGRKGGDALKLKLFARCAQRVTDGKQPRVKHADDVARVGLFNDLALCRHDLLRL
ncbi:hypothetical protein SDC9_91282 [bioreactor metagenome]|uniref:Uncharacterized protein n=1 Tax=bioreactor metagenome TaxID=1076179 RepID=A0A645A185_9ZZZZ